MIQSITSLRLTAYVRNEGERRARKIIMHLKSKGAIVSQKAIFGHAIPALHPGEGKTKIVGRPR